MKKYYLLWFSDQEGGSGEAEALNTLLASEGISNVMAQLDDSGILLLDYREINETGYKRENDEEYITEWKGKTYQLVIGHNPDGSILDVMLSRIEDPEKEIDLYFSARTKGSEYKDTLKVGQKVCCGLYGGMYGVISKIDGEQRPETIRTFGGIAQMGGNAHFTVIFEDHISTYIPECVIKGVQWDISNEILTADQIAQVEKNTYAKIAEKKRIEDEERAAVEKQKSELPRLHPELTPYCMAGRLWGATLGAKNMRTEFKAKFPGVKFSVNARRFAGGDSIDVEWTGGPQIEEVREITRKYEEGRFDGMTDSYDYKKNDAWTDIFGGTKYLHLQRNLTMEEREALPKLQGER